MRTTTALTTVLFAAISIALLMLAGCSSDEKVLTPTKKPVTVSPADTPSDTAIDENAAPEETPTDVAIKETPAIPEDDKRVVPGPYQTLYCNLLNIELDDATDMARSDLEDADRRIADIQSNLAGATGADKVQLQTDLREAQSSKTAVNKDIDATNKKVADMGTKCKKLDKAKDATICAAFTKDIQARIAVQQASLASEQKQLGFMANDAAKATRQQRKILAEQRTLDRLNAVKTDLTQRCS